jgi:acyl-CoA thioesterase FadM
MVTARLSVRYRKPVPIEKPLKLFGTLKEDTGLMVKATGEIRDETGAILAEADVLLANFPPQLQQNLTQLTQDEWKVYPDER